MTVKLLGAFCFLFYWGYQRKFCSEIIIFFVIIFLFPCVFVVYSLQVFNF